MEDLENTIIGLLETVPRNGMSALIECLKRDGFFKSPASTKYHYAFEGGLMMHSYSVYELFNKMNIDFNLNLSKDLLIICPLLHDVCKMKLYRITPNGIKHNGISGHSKLSLEILKEHVELTKTEEQIIFYHMGFYGTTEFNSKNGEYKLQEMVNTYNISRIAKLFYFCDDMSTNFLEAEIKKSGDLR